MINIYIGNKDLKQRINELEKMVLDKYTGKPLPAEQCKRIKHIFIHKHKDGTYGYRTSGMLPFKDVVRCITKQIGQRLP